MYVMHVDEIVDGRVDLRAEGCLDGDVCDGRLLGITSHPVQALQAYSDRKGGCRQCMLVGWIICH